MIAAPQFSTISLDPEQQQLAGGQAVKPWQEAGKIARYLAPAA
ncbi:hypothetical protein [Bradyrhizobium sp. DASA03120]